MGEGFFEPVDDIGPERTPHAPRTLEYLAASFATSGYDTQWLLRTIIATEAYQRESRSRRAYEDLPFLANVPQRLRADQLYDALSQTLGRDLGDGFQARRGGGIYGLASARAAFAGVFGYDPSDPRREVSGAIPQALALMNSPGLNQLVTSSRGPLSSMMREMEDNEEIVVELYLRAISREPESVELARCLEHVAKADSRTAAFEDILWVLINSSEFLHRG